VTLNADRRPGLLTRVGFVAANSRPTRTFPTSLGKTLSSRLLYLPVSEPSPEIQSTFFPQLKSDPTQTFRQQMATLTAVRGDCIGCHRTTDPLGFAFEKFDFVGAARLQDENGLTLDSSTDSPLLGKLADAADVAKAIAVNADAHSCFADNVFRFAAARADQPGDACIASKLTQTLTTSNLNIRSLLLSMYPQSGSLTFRSGFSVLNPIAQHLTLVRGLSNPAFKASTKAL
jgi:hypothetical protein